MLEQFLKKTAKLTLVDRVAVQEMLDIDIPQVKFLTDILTAFLVDFLIAVEHHVPVVKIAALDSNRVVESQQRVHQLT